MKNNLLKNAALTVVLLLTIFDPGNAQIFSSSRQLNAANSQNNGKVVSLIEERNVRAHMEFLAGDALQGRGSGTQFEWLAAQYIASQMRQFRVEPAGETDAAGEKTYIQTVNVTRNFFDEAPRISYNANGQQVVLENGKQIVVLRMNVEEIKGALQKITLDEKPKTGAIAFIKLRAGEESQNISQKLQALAGSGAAAVIVEETAQLRAQWENLSARKLSFTRIPNVSGNPFASIVISNDAANALSSVEDGTIIEIKGKLAAPQIQKTWNAVGMLAGGDSVLSTEVILLSAHLDHLGVRPNAPGEDKIFNGADDDASGCVAVLELARVLAAGKRPKRTVYFAFFGSEEAGGIGSQFFAGNLSFPKEKLTANLQFEMIGRPDAKVGADQLWLTGYDRSNLGAELAKHGAKLVADPHPDQNFFQRSDNYTLARQGIIAHTVSSFGLHADYHKASDELKTINLKHMTSAIDSMVRPVDWLVNSNFKPIWFEGKKP
jgi:Zn-dependent M28 family amino/carboxypeptidase